MSLRLGYLIGRYPAAPHAFLLREVEALRDLDPAAEAKATASGQRPSGRRADRTS